jgi:hypothetical protein
MPVIPRNNANVSVTTWVLAKICDDLHSICVRELSACGLYRFVSLTIKSFATRYQQWEKPTFRDLTVELSQNGRD